MLSDVNTEVILAYAECDMNANETARYMKKDKHTVYFHFDRIKRETGLDPKCFYDLVELVDIANGTKP